MFRLCTYFVVLLILQYVSVFKSLRVVKSNSMYYLPPRYDNNTIANTNYSIPITVVDTNERTNVEFHSQYTFNYTLYELIDKKNIMQLSKSFCHFHELDVKYKDCFEILAERAFHHAWDVEENTEYEKLLKNYEAELYTSHLETETETGLRSVDECPMGRVVVITSTFCGYDSVKPVVIPVDNVSRRCTSYLAFADDHISSPLGIHTHSRTDDANRKDADTSRYYPWQIIHSLEHIQRRPHEGLGKNNRYMDSTQFGHMSYADVCLMSAKKYRMQSQRILSRMIANNDSFLMSSSGGQIVPDYVVWVDSSRYIANPNFYYDVVHTMNPEIANSSSYPADLVFFQHSAKSTVKQEVEEAMKQSRYQMQLVDVQYQMYVESGFQDEHCDLLDLNSDGLDAVADHQKINNIGVFDTSSFVYRFNSPVATMVLDEWYRHNVLYSYEDQISLSYILWDYQQVHIHRNANGYASIDRDGYVKIHPRFSIMHLVGPRPPFSPHDLNTPTIPYPVVMKQSIDKK